MFQMERLSQKSKEWSCVCHNLIGWKSKVLDKCIRETLQEKSKLETDNSVSNMSGNGILEGLKTEFSVFIMLVSNCVCLNFISN